MTLPAHGVLGTIDSSGHVSYTPSFGYSGPDSFTFKTTDNHGVDSGTATVNLTVSPAPVPAPPTCTDGSISTGHNTAVAISLSCSASGAITYSIVSPPSHGTLGAVGSAGGVTFTPAAGFSGTDSFTFKATDTHGQDSNVATVTVTVGPDHAPTCSGQTVSVPHGTAKQIALGCSDADAGNTLHWSVVTPPSHGTLSAIDSSGGLTYTPASGFGGLDRFTFEATDNEGLSSAAATVSLDVAASVPCSGLTGKKLKACKAKLKLQAALKRCATIQSETKRKACIAAAKRTYRRALQARVVQAHVPGKAPVGHRPPPRMVYRRPRRR